MNNVNRIIEQEIDKQKLPSNFIDVVSEYYQPLAGQIILKAQSHTNAPCLLLGVQGTQGSGKSTCASFLKLLFESQYNKRTLVISIDDFYLTLLERQALAKKVHPLLLTRGVPGTHDIALLEETLKQCANFETGNSVSIPTFDKAADDRANPAHWQTITEPVDIIIIEGWCVGTTPQAESKLQCPVNPLEAEEDSDQVWRNFVNRQLSKDYAQLYTKLDYLVTLQAPSFACVFEWRLLQEQKLAEKLKQAGKDSSGVQSEQQLRRFISHYQRLTEHALETMPNQADWILFLRQDHGFSKLIAKL